MTTIDTDLESLAHFLSKEILEGDLTYPEALEVYRGMGRFLMEVTDE